MMNHAFKYLYGPVYSWRMGISLGIDPVSDKHKICNLNCVYCQLGKTHEFTNTRKDFVPTEAIIAEIKSLPPISLDYFTFSGRGEPTLARNLGEMIKGVRAFRPEKIAVITNATLMHQKSVRDDLSSADYVLAKLDAYDQHTYELIDHPFSKISFYRVLEGIKDFRENFNGKFALQMMFINKNKNFVLEMSELARYINPDEVQINTPLRPSAARPLSAEELDEIGAYFGGLNVISVYEKERKIVESFDDFETMRRHGNFRDMHISTTRK